MAEVADPVAASQGATNLPDEQTIPEHQAAESTPIHSVAGAILRRSMRLVDVFEQDENLDALIYLMQGVNAFATVTKSEAKDIEIDVSAVMPLEGGNAYIVTTLRRK